MLMKRTVKSPEFAALRVAFASGMSQYWDKSRIESVPSSQTPASAPLTSAIPEPGPKLKNKKGKKKWSEQKR